MSSNDAYIEISTSNAYKFTNASNNDIVFYGTNSANQVLIGSTSNAYAGVTVGLSNVSLSVMGNDSNSSINFKTNNSATNAMTILGNANVGIGKTNPAYALDVAGTVNATQVLVNGSNISASGATAGGFVASNGGITYTTCNVGIGKSNPAYALDVSGTVNATQLLIGGTALSTSTGGGFAASNGSITYSLCNVGIGKSNPSVPLDVVGNVNVTGLLTVSNMSIPGTLTVVNATECNITSSNLTANTVTINSNLTFSQNISVGGLTLVRGLGSNTSITTAVPGYTFCNNNSNINVGPSSYSNAVVVSGTNGYVGVANSNPQYPLDVVGNANFSGNISASALQINGSNLSVFYAPLSTSNTAVAASNTAYPASNAAFWGSNTAVAASNTAYAALPKAGGTMSGALIASAGATVYGELATSNVSNGLRLYDRSSAGNSMMIFADTNNLYMGPSGSAQVQLNTSTATFTPPVIAPSFYAVSGTYTLTSTTQTVYTIPSGASGFISIVSRGSAGSYNCKWFGYFEWTSGSTGTSLQGISSLSVNNTITVTTVSNSQIQASITSGSASFLVTVTRMT